MVKLAAWILQSGLAVVFLYFGITKFSPDNQLWIGMFETIGIGQWFRYFTGGLEVICAVALLIPRVSVPAAVLLASTMVAASFIRILVLQNPIVSVVVPVSCLGALLTVIWMRWQSRPHLPRSTN